MSAASPTQTQTLKPARTGLDPFALAFEETLHDVLDIRQWRSGDNLAVEHVRIQAEVDSAVRYEGAVERQVRAELLPKVAELSRGMNPVPHAGHYTDMTVADLAAIHTQILFNGGVTACDGTVQVHDTLAMTVYQIGVCLVNYAGNSGSWSTRLFRRDLRERVTDPIGDMLAVLEARGQRAGLAQTSRRDELSELARRAIMTYAEVAALTDEVTTPWRLGHGSPAPLQLLSGAGSPDVAIQSIRLLTRLIDDHQRFVYVTSEPSLRHFLTFGQALRPLEYVVLGRLDEWMETYTQDISYSGPVTVDNDGLEPAKWVRRFREETACNVVIGVFRASPIAPPHLFYAHKDHVHMAARIALADAVLLPQRGWPLLVDLADRACKSVYGGGRLKDLTDAAYARHGAAVRYGSERDTRPI